jgi:hypothetical protein
MPQTGQILFHRSFVFEDGTKGDKLFIVLNNCDNKEDCLVLKTTSQTRRYAGVKTGCNADKKVFCIRKDCNQGFPTDTWVQMDNIFPLNVEKLLLEKQITFIDHLNEYCISTLKKCLRNYRDDIPVKYWALIYQPTSKK